MPYYYIPKKEFKVVFKDEIKRYIENSPDDDFKFVLILSWLTGLRINEVINLKKENFIILPEQDIIQITTQVQKFGKQANPVFSFSDPYILEIVDFINKHDYEKKLFKRGKRRYQQILLNLNKQLNSDDKSKYITFHYLRHSRITFLARHLRAFPEEIKAWTGHSSQAFEEYIAPRRVERFKGKFGRSFT